MLISLLSALIYSTMGIIGSQMVGTKWKHLITKGKMGSVTIMKSRIKAVIRIAGLADT